MWTSGRSAPPTKPADRAPGETAHSGRGPEQQGGGAVESQWLKSPKSHHCRISTVSLYLWVVSVLSLLYLLCLCPVCLLSLSSFAANAAQGTRRAAPRCRRTTTTTTTQQQGGAVGSTWPKCHHCRIRNSTVSLCFCVVFLLSRLSPVPLSCLSPVSLLFCSHRGTRHTPPRAAPQQQQQHNNKEEP